MTLTTIVIASTEDDIWAAVQFCRKYLPISPKWGIANVQDSIENQVSGSAIRFKQVAWVTATFNGSHGWRVTIPMLDISGAGCQNNSQVLRQAVTGKFFTHVS